MFEAGKKYKHSGTHGIYECLHAIDKLGWVIRDGENDIYKWDRYWSEYVEPRKEYFAVLVSETGKSEFYGPVSTRSKAEGKLELLGGRESYGEAYGILILTHHSDTKVETEFHLHRKSK